MQTRRNPHWSPWFALLLLLSNGAALGRNLPYPLLFLPGLNESAEDWTPVRQLLDRRIGLHYGGVTPRQGLSDEAAINRADYFFVDLDTDAPLLSQVQTLRQAILQVRRSSGSQRVVLVGFSAGGLVGRLYLTSFVDDHHVAKLVTVASPHQGSNLAAVAYLGHWCRQQQSADGDGWQGITASFSCGLLQRLEDKLGIPLDSPALQDLIPRDSYSLISERALATHPTDVEYAAIIGRAPRFNDPHTFSLFSREQDLGQSAGLLNSMTADLIDHLRNWLPDVLPVGADTLSPGDGAVSLISQDLSRLPWFAERLKQTGHQTHANWELRRYSGNGHLRMEVLKLEDHHHLAQRRDMKALWRIISGPSELRRVRSYSNDIRGEVRDFLFNPRLLVLERWHQNAWQPLSLTQQPLAERFSFQWDDQGLHRRERVRIGYPQLFGDTLRASPQYVELDSSTASLPIGTAALPWLVAALLAAAAAAWWLANSKPRPRKPPSDDWHDQF